MAISSAEFVIEAHAVPERDPHHRRVLALTERVFVIATDLRVADAR